MVGPVPGHAASITELPRTFLTVQQPKSSWLLYRNLRFSTS